MNITLTPSEVAIIRAALDIRAVSLREKAHEPATVAAHLTDLLISEAELSERLAERFTP